MCPGRVRCSTLKRTWSRADHAAAGDLMHADVVLADMSLRTQVIGRMEATKYLERILGDAPYGGSSVLRHVVGGRRGGAFEWTAGRDAGSIVGITALELGAAGLITKLASVYDSRQLEPACKSNLVAASG